jgi:hypothetical protein
VHPEWHNVGLAPGVLRRIIDLGERLGICVAAEGTGSHCNVSVTSTAGVHFRVCICFALSVC